MTTLNENIIICIRMFHSMPSVALCIEQQQKKETISAAGNAFPPFFKRGSQVVIICTYICKDYRFAELK
jgi:hypothetical protein